jgi:hypothetical protein
MGVETFQEYLRRTLGEMKDIVFQPNVWFNKEGNLLEVYWEEEPAYAEETSNHVMALM